MNAAQAPHLSHLSEGQGLVGRHPREVLLGAQAQTGFLPVCDHYSGVEARMRKSLQLQAEMTQEFGTCVFDVTLDCEDGAPVGAEAAHARLVAALACEAAPQARVAVRVHPVGHPAFANDMATIAGEAGQRLCHIMIPKVESIDDVLAAEQALLRAAAGHLPLHVLIESPQAVHRAFEIAAHPRVQSLSFGLMDFVSAHGGAIPASAMTSAGQFSHPLVLRAKLEIAAACHAYGKVPAHCVVTEFSDAAAMKAAATRAARELGYTRMWSIHPAQIRPILEAFAPTQDDVEHAAKIIAAAADGDWAPINFDGVLHDRASYRYYWQVLERAHRTGLPLPAAVQEWFTSPASSDAP
ncbi:HpcH/HpaI aldolase/citrate lyase family protein [Extensimonas vulgaris]|uniref:Citrate lyase subunit beta/citryl-CoA lyase n=1 Tax=Extensimonas vulgaris TaxID=1031594 RepID=A0A369AKX0_9BURK|nr:aldolase/citrate lyase family protein [Extensimonas vulgaris]RCX08978.1 citrate lyase subunit beta/citryl-CoA lyase [Extensimonas vulgaris]TWI37214.1 citrate lyase subunit beta/citryl-CoA lyase [Extensimonas vulgaris]TXD14298.1 CoA ester lyase [Extensimonas vulgaris]